MGGRGAAFESKGYSARMKAAEGKICRDNVEHAVVLDKQGNVVFKKSENLTNAVTFTTEELKKMQGMNFTHNHPHNSTFSEEDISVMTRWGLNSMRATGKERTYQLSRTKSAKANQDFAKDYSIAQQKNKKIVDKEYNRYKKQMQRGMITATEFQNKIPGLNSKLNKLNSEWLKENAKSYGYRYSVIERRK